MTKGRRKITADEVRALPVGTRVRVHGRDMRGRVTEVEYIVVQYGKGKRLSWGGSVTRPIVKTDGTAHYYSVEGGE